MSRIDRLASVIQREIADTLLKKMHHRDIGIVSILRVKLSKDLDHAWVYYSVLGNADNRTKTAAMFETAKGFIRAQVGKALFIQTIPQLHFVYDDSLEKTQTLIDRINEISKL